MISISLLTGDFAKAEEIADESTGLYQTAIVRYHDSPMHCERHIQMLFDLCFYKVVRNRRADLRRRIATWETVQRQWREMQSDQTILKRYELQLSLVKTLSLDKDFDGPESRHLPVLIGVSPVQRFFWP